MRSLEPDEHGRGGDARIGADARRQAPGPVRRLWSRVRRGSAARPSLAARPELAAMPAYLAAPEAVAKAGQPVLHLAQAAGGPFVETRLAREVRGLLAALGSTRGEVALTLERHGVRAPPGVHGPLACYLEAVVGADPHVKSVVVDADAVGVELRSWWRPAVVVEFPSAVRSFEVAFDALCYPRLLPAGYPTSDEGEHPAE